MTKEQLLEISLSYLDMDWARRNVTEEEIKQCIVPGATSSQDSSEPAEVKSEAEDLGPPPPAASQSAPWLRRRLEEEGVRVGVQIEPRQGHDEIEELVLDRDHDFSKCIKVHEAFVVR